MVNILYEYLNVTIVVVFFRQKKKDYEIIIKPVKIKDDFGWFRSIECATYKITCPDCNATDFYNEISKPDSVEYPYVSGTCW